MGVHVCCFETLNECARWKLFSQNVTHNRSEIKILSLLPSSIPRTHHELVAFTLGYEELMMSCYTNLHSLGPQTF